MSMDNCKAADTEIVRGNPTAKSAILGLRVKDVSTKEGREGPVGHLTIVGLTRVATKMVGEECEIQTAGSSRKMVGHVQEVKVTEGKKGNITTVKVVGSPELHKLGLVQVQMTQLQGELPGIDPEDQDAPRLGELEVPTSRAKKKARRGGRRRGGGSR